MSYRIIKGILGEELARLNALSRRYRLEIAKIPKGSISLKQRGSRRYAYLVFRKDSKIMFKYIGPAGSDDVIAAARQIRMRKQFESKLKAVSSDIKKIERTTGRRAV
jgi:hypothetical protein